MGSAASGAAATGLEERRDAHRGKARGLGAFEAGGLVADPEPPPLPEGKRPSLQVVKKSDEYE